MTMTANTKKTLADSTSCNSSGEGLTHPTADTSKEGSTSMTSTTDEINVPTWASAATPWAELADGAVSRTVTGSAVDCDAIYDYDEQAFADDPPLTTVDLYLVAEQTGSADGVVSTSRVRLAIGHAPDHTDVLLDEWHARHLAYKLIELGSVALNENRGGAL